MKFKKNLFISLTFIFSFFSCLSQTTELQTKQKGIICVAAADLRSIPQENKSEIKYPITFKDNKHQVSQSLFGEQVLILETNKDWLKVQATEQIVYTDKNGWFPITCFVKANQVKKTDKYFKNNIVVNKQWTKIYSQPNLNSKTIIPICIGTRLYGKKFNNKWYQVKLPNNKIGAILVKDVNNINSSQLNNNQIRKNIISTAQTFLNSPYCWGGRSTYNPKLKTQISGPDCSAFTNLVYRTNGLEIPRNSHSQFVASQKVNLGKNLKPGDLIFMAYDKKTIHVNHVLLYLGNNMIIESTVKDDIKGNRIISCKERFGSFMEEIISGKKYKDTLVFLGTFFNSNQKQN